MEDYFICILGIGLLLAIAYGWKWWKERPWYKAGVKKPGPLSISKEAYRKANQYVERSGPASDVYQEWGTLTAQKYDVLKYEAFDFPVSLLFARILRAYHNQCEIDKYTDDLLAPNIQIGARDSSQIMRKMKEMKSSAYSPFERSDKFRKKYCNKLIDDLNIGKYRDDLRKLGKELYWSEAFKSVILTIYIEFKTLEVATIRTVKEKYGIRIVPSSELIVKSVLILALAAAVGTYFFSSESEPVEQSGTATNIVRAATWTPRKVGAESGVATHFTKLSTRTPKKVGGQSGTSSDESHNSSDSSSTEQPYVLHPPDSSFPSCDKFGTELSIGKQAAVVWEIINIRKEPFVPENPSSNVVATLKTGDMVQVIDGVACAYGGYWWKIKTESGITGWAREKSKEGEVYVWPID